MLVFARKSRAVEKCRLSVGSARAAALAVFTCLALPAFTQTPSNYPQSSGQVIYLRSTNLEGQTTTTVGPAAASTGGQMVNAPVAVNAERQAVTFTGFDMDVHLRPAEQYIAARARVTVRNTGAAPLAHVPLQISSSLSWERIRVSGRDVAYTVATLNSDADHTGQLHEAAVPLPQPLAPGATLQLDVTYAGKIAPNAQRLTAIGTPDDAALHSDWDGIGVEFTGLRGFGNVVWYPVASVPALLGNGAQLFDEIGRQKLRAEGARFQLRLTVEFPQDATPTVALINGHPAPLAVTGGGAGVPGVATADYQASTLGFESPNLFLAVRKPEKMTNATLWTLPADEAAVPAWATAASTVTPFLQDWMGDQPRSQLTIIDLPDPLDAPFESGALLAMAVGQASPEQLDSVMAHALTHAWMDSPRAWLNEGVADFMGTLWIEKNDGRAEALESLEASRTALAIAEPSSPGESAGQPLGQAYSPIYYRTKAAYVLWMLRDLVGDAALSSVFRAYNPAQDQIASDQIMSNLPSSQPGEFENLVRRASPGKNLDWFFADWVDADKGLPDLTISKVYSEPAEAGATLVGVTIANSGYAAAEVPVTVRTALTSVTQRMLIPAQGEITQRILVQGAPTKVLVNDGGVPETEASVHVTTLGNPAAGSSSQNSMP